MSDPLTIASKAEGAAIHLRQHQLPSAALDCIAAAQLIRTQSIELQTQQNTIAALRTDLHTVRKVARVA